MTDFTKLAKQCGATSYVNRHYPGETAIAFSPPAWVKFCGGIALYTHPAKELVGLTAEDIEAVLYMDQTSAAIAYMLNLALKAKNGGQS